jgi:outer membrane lipoprotein carrier protein
MVYQGEINMKKILALIATLFFLFSIAYAGDKDSADLQSRLSSLRTLKANFKETVSDEDGGILQISSGVVTIKKPGYFRWEILSPSPQLIVTDGSRVWIYDEDLAQVIIQHLGNRLTQTPFLLLSNDNFSLEQEFDIKEDVDGHFTLLPKNKGEDFKSITLSFNGLDVNKLYLKTAVGENTEIDFSNVQTNLPVDEKIFHFVPPRNVDVQDETAKN